MTMVSAAGTIIVRAQAVDSSGGGSSFQHVFRYSPRDSIINLPQQFILKGTDTVWCDSTLLQNGKHYFLDERFGILTLKIYSLPISVRDTSSQHVIKIRYRAFPFNFQGEYRHREPVMRKDTAGGRVHQAIRSTRSFSVDEFFGSGLQKSGTIVRGLTIGTNRDLSLNSGFRMQMSGNIAENVEVIAALTDENTPIQPEGTTQTLQEFDKVFVEIKGSEMGATLGDFNVNLTGNEFGRFSRKVQGAQGNANYKSGISNGDILVAGAVTRGKFTSNQFQGIEGVQGPYRLVGQNNERNIIVIAGTERVYVNGEPMTRGAINDYTIDYGNGEIIFTSRRLIARSSRITVDFEYTDRQFNRTMLTLNTRNRFLQDRVTLNATFINETDDKDSPIDISMSDSDRAVLSSAGSDRLKAARSGVEFVGQSKGQYKDSLIINSITGDTLRIFKYSPYDSMNAVYAVTFSYVGDGYGDYNKISVGHYEFIGVRKGSYAPIRLLPMPQSHSLTDIDGALQLTDDLSVTGEYALSNFDVNRFSGIGDENNVGGAFKFSLGFKTNGVRFGGRNLGSISLDFKERFINKNFVSIDRINEIEFNRKWNIEDSSKVNEELREGSLSYQPIEPLTIGGGIGWLRRGDIFSSDRYGTSVHLAGKGLPKADYDIEIVKSRDDRTAASSHWTRQKGDAEVYVGKLTSGVRYENETRRDRSPQVVQSFPGSFRFNEISPFLYVKDIGPVIFGTEWGWRWDDSLAAGELRRASASFTQRYDWELREWNSLSSTLNLVLRQRKFTKEFRQRNNNDFNTVLIRSQTRFNPFSRGIETDWFYEVASERSAKMERVFQRVPKGNGNYIYRRDVNNNHIIDEPDFEPTRFDGDFVAILVPSDALIPVTDVKASTRIRCNFNRLISSEKWLTKTLSLLSTETYLRVEEKSAEGDPKQIYLLHLSHFLNDKTTLTGNNLVSQDLYIAENNPEFSLRLRFSQRRGLTQFTLQNERTYACERSLRIRLRLIKELSNQVDLTEKKNNLYSTQASDRVRNIFSNSLSSDWSYRPDQSIEFGFVIGVSRAINFDTTTADINDESIRLVYSFEGQGQARVELAREEVIVNNGANFLPFELSGGKLVGQSWLWRLAVDYRLTQFLQATVDYNGRSENGGRIIHTGRAEVRAFF